MASELELERGYRNVPVLDDQTLVWRCQDGDSSAVYVSGALAEGTGGPIARNVVGAKRASERIATALPLPRTAASNQRTNGRSVADD